MSICVAVIYLTLLFWLIRLLASYSIVLHSVL
jgi:hypothetical protein